MREKAISLIKVRGKRAALIAGNDVALGFLPDGRPDTETHLPVCYQPVATAPWHPSVGYWIDELQKVRKPRKSLTPAEVVEIKRLKENKVRLQDLADRFGVSVSTIKRV
jgi:hypothetical protein